MRRIWLYLGLALLVPGMLMNLFEAAALDRGYHLSQHARLNSAQATGLNQAGVERATDHLIGYLRGTREDIRWTDEVYGVRQRVFNEREEAHMADVRALFEAGRALRSGLWLAGGLLTALGLMLWRSLKGFFRALTVACAAWIGLIALAVGLAATNFSAAFVWMHERLFTNELWMLNERTDLMIRMLPEDFFVAVAGHIALFLGIGLIALALMGIAGQWALRETKEPGRRF